MAAETLKRAAISARGATEQTASPSLARGPSLTQAATGLPANSINKPLHNEGSI